MDRRQHAAPDGDGDLSPAGARVVRLTIPAKPEYITLGRLALAGLARLRPLSEEAVADLKLALTEACSNSVRHAYPRGEGTVEILYELHADMVVIEVADHGEGFLLDERAENGEDLSEGGLGIAIIRAVTDDVQVSERESGPGARLRFVKRLAA